MFVNSCRCILNARCKVLGFFIYAPSQEQIWVDDGQTGTLENYMQLLRNIFAKSKIFTKYI